MCSVVVWYVSEFSHSCVCVSLEHQLQRHHQHRAFAELQFQVSLGCSQHCR